MAIAETAAKQLPQGDVVWAKRLLDNQVSITLRRLELIPIPSTFNANDRALAETVFEKPRRELLDSFAETLTQKLGLNIEPHETPKTIPHIKQLIEPLSQADYYLKFAAIAGESGLDTGAFFEPVEDIVSNFKRNNSHHAISVLRKVALTRIQLGTTASDAFQDVDAELDRQTSSPRDIYGAVELLLEGEDIILDKLDSNDNAGAINTYEMLLKKDEVNGPGDFFGTETMERINEARKKLGGSLV